MSVETDFFAAITGDAGINPLIGTRLYPVRLPDDVTLPAAAYWVVSTMPIGSGGCKQSRVQLDLYATTYNGVKAIRDAVIAFVDGQNQYWYSVAADAWLEPPEDKYHQPIDLFVAHT
jgi:hypothetical protein